MHRRDISGLIVSGASAAAVDAYNEAVDCFHCYAGPAPELIEQAIADSPGFTMAHVLKAWMNLVGAPPEAQADGFAAYEAAVALGGDDREKGHIAALTALVGGEIQCASRILEDVAIEHPRDALALHFGQLCDYFTGDARMMRDRIARALPFWSESQPDYHAVLGFAAFGLEEAGYYGRAEALGRKAVELQPRNGWARHAVAHVLEMQDRRADGIAFMREDIPSWTEESFFQVHNWWHLGLFHLGLGDVQEVLNLWDGPIYGEPSQVLMDMVDAAAMLWRLQLAGVDVGARWGKIADVYETKAAFGRSAFDDAHATMAFVGAGRREGIEAVLAAQKAALEGPGDNAEAVRVVGLPLIQGIQAYGEGDWGGCVERLREVRNRAYRFGGSNAQRDLIDITLIEAARRAGELSLERALLAERAAAKPDIPGEGRVLSRAA
ncbi:tetratricopeptide repeat protein [Phenylobacterium terrae]|uniref:Tetratricopeptide repeat protein 38 n=1 Tax=Phenylobacterium terrae TaxID=2665495 RepID=A0ABW4N2G2_9CAUL